MPRISPRSASICPDNNVAVRSSNVTMQSGNVGLQFSFQLGKISLRRQMFVAAFNPAYPFTE